MRIINSIKFKFTLGVFVLVTAITVLLSVVSYTYEKQAIQNRIFAQLSAIADLKKKLIVTYLNERMADLNALTALGYFKKQVLVLLDAQTDPLSNKTALQDIYQLLTSLNNITQASLSLEIIDMNGAMIISSEHGLKGADHRSDHEYRTTLSKYAEALKGDDSLFLQDHVRDNYITLAKSIHDEQGRIQAVLIYKVDLADTILPLFRDYTGLGLTGETLLVRRTGSKISFISPSRHQQQTSDIDTDVIDSEEYQKLSRLATAGNEGIDQALDYRKKAVIGAYRYIPNLGWGIIAKIDADEAFAETTALRKKTVLLATVILAVMLVIAFMVVRKFTSPIDRLDPDNQGYNRRPL